MNISVPRVKTRAKATLKSEIPPQDSEMPRKLSNGQRSLARTRLCEPRLQPLEVEAVKSNKTEMGLFTKQQNKMQQPRSLKSWP